MGRSLQVKSELVKQIKTAVTRNGYPSQTALASGLGLSRDVVNRFLNGKPVDYLNAEEICRALGLDLGEMTGYGQKIKDKSVLIGTQTALVNIVNPNFVGRESAIADLNALVAKEAKVILIQGAGGVGKTTLARKYLADKFGDKVIEFPIAKETKDIVSIEGLLEQCLRSLGEEPGRDFLVSLMRLKEKLQTEAMGVLIDNIEPALDGSGRLIEAHRRYIELLRILADPTVKSITLITSREALGEGVDISLYRLPILDLEAWQTYFYNRGITHNNQVIEQIWDAYQGNALAMKLLCDRIFLDYVGDLVTFWEEQQKLGALLNIENLIEEQFNRLENIYPDAYKLLCRMGCYRYQDVDVPLEGLFCLLWDALKNQRGQVINALRDRSLVNYSDGKYYLHPLIRNEAINRLRNSEDWKKANIKAAEFWTDNVKNIDTVKEALQALEAYYHYFNIDDYEKASEIILLSRKNKFQTLENLGEAFCRLGLLERMITCANKLIPYLDKSYLLIDKSLSLVALYNVLGALYSYRGEIALSIKFYQISGEICERCIQITQGSEQKLFWKKQLNKVYYFIGLCKVDLFELQEAKTVFEKALNSYTLEFCHENRFNESEIKVARIDILVYIAFLYSCLSQEEARKLADKLLIDIFDINLFFASGSIDILVYMAFLYPCLLQEEVRKLADELLIDIFDKDLFFSSWTKGYNPLFLAITFKNLGEFKKSFEMYNHAIRYAKESNFNQIEATALIYLGELYRIQENYDIALDHHFQSITILDKIGAKCDLAEAYFQLALTYQAVGDQPNSQTYFDKALDLWGPEQIDAPEQIKRVKNVIQITPATENG